MRQALIMRPAKFAGLMAAMLLLAALFSACAPRQPRALPPTEKAPDSYVVDGITYYPLDKAHRFCETGRASWYGNPFHGRKTANRETYDMYALTAAHKLLPFGTIVEVRNLENDRTVMVRINDRGPFVGSRVIDLSYTAAEKLDMIKNGTAEVQITAIGTDDLIFQRKLSESDYFTGDFAIQVGAFAEEANARNLGDRLKKEVGSVEIVPFTDVAGRVLYRVRVGRFSSLNQAEKQKESLSAAGFSNIYTVARDE